MEAACIAGTVSLKRQLALPVYQRGGVPFAVPPD